MIIIEWKHIIEAKAKQCHIIHGRTLTVREFRGSSKSPTLWTSKRAMQAWNSQRYIFGQSIPVGFAFKRPWERRTFSGNRSTMRVLHLTCVKLALTLKEQVLEIVQKIPVFGLTLNLHLLLLRGSILINVLFRRLVLQEVFL